MGLDTSAQSPPLTGARCQCSAIIRPTVPLPLAECRRRKGLTLLTYPEPCMLASALV